jgi:hypothetical protein
MQMVEIWIPQIDPRRAVATRQDSINVRDHSRNSIEIIWIRDILPIYQKVWYFQKIIIKSFIINEDRSANRGRTCYRKW